jgi:protoporphyrin/coproporphyrin ferrochelatase
MTKTAVVLLNLGGPDSKDAVQPFLYNMFKDKAILRVSPLIRKPLAWIISRLRAGKASAIYRQIGGRSPIVEETQAQASALEAVLERNGDYKVFVSMRYWHPLSDAVAKNVKIWEPDHVVLLPLYPQFSSATTASSFADWDKAARAAGLDAPTTKLCCYPVQGDFLAAHANLIKDTYWKASEHGKPRILFSAHGLPEKIANAGDPYAWQIKETVSGIMKILAIDDADYTVCYQSRVGRLKWLSPYTEEELARAGEDKVPVVVVPISFVSEHAETLVELDIAYRKRAEERGVPDYQRVPALGIEPHFIEALAELCRSADASGGTQSFTKHRFCPRSFDACPCANETLL